MTHNANTGRAYTADDLASIARSHDARGHYYVSELLNHPTYTHTVMCPDGTEHQHFTSYDEAARESYRLNAEDRRNRAMTDADRLAAIRAIVAELDALDDPSEDDAETETLAAIRDILTGRYPELYAYLFKTAP